jgi:hypothetical protein
MNAAEWSRLKFPVVACRYVSQEAARPARQSAGILASDERETDECHQPEPSAASVSNLLGRA